ncbi:MAG TPA: BamA/TamA family outer membrane protein [Methylomirabilota bacterium]|nr:BamA/TamA family outer membrane protein [Methylomirabilota bacterium]
MLPVLLFRDAANEVRSIVAPSLTYNEIRGWTGTFRYFAYPSAAERVDVVAAYSETIERKLDLHYRNLGLFANRFHADVQLLHDRDAAIRFFGLGPESKKVDETNMTLEVTGFYAILGVNLTSTARLSLGETVQRFEVRRGGVPNLPFTGDVFPTLPGVQGATVHAQRIALAYDSRDSLTTPTRGLAVTLYSEASSELLGSGSDYIKSGVEAIYLHPVWDRRLVIVSRGLVEAISAEADTPFQVRPSLGGATTLRGYSQNRFFGDARVLANLEGRIRLFKLALFGVTAEFEMAPFVDVGKVFSSTEQLVGSGFEVTPGVGFRGLAPPSVVGHIEIGVSREGPAIFVGLDYPF